MWHAAGSMCQLGAWRAQSSLDFSGPQRWQHWANVRTHCSAVGPRRYVNQHIIVCIWINWLKLIEWLCLLKNVYTRLVCSGSSLMWITQTIFFCCCSRMDFRFDNQFHLFSALYEYTRGPPIIIVSNLCSCTLHDWPHKRVYCGHWKPSYAIRLLQSLIYYNLPEKGKLIAYNSWIWGPLLDMIDQRFNFLSCWACNEILKSSPEWKCQVVDAIASVVEETREANDETCVCALSSLDFFLFHSIAVTARISLI